MMPLRILLADENLAVQKLVEMTLGREGMDVTATDNGLSALDLAIKRTPDLILADFNLEGLDIFSFIKKVKRHERLSGTPVMLMINATQVYDPKQFQDGDVAAFFKKPIDAVALLEAVRMQTRSAENFLEGLESPKKEDVTDIAQCFSDAEDETENLESLLGWSPPEVDRSDVTSETEDRPESTEEDTIVSPPLSGSAGEQDHGRAAFESFPFGLPSEAPQVSDISEVSEDAPEISVVPNHPSSEFPFASPESPLDASSEAPKEVSDAEAFPEKELLSADFSAEADTPASAHHSGGIADFPATDRQKITEEEKASISPTGLGQSDQDVNEILSEAAELLQPPLEDKPSLEDIACVAETPSPDLEKGTAQEADQAGASQVSEVKLTADRLLPEEAIRKQMKESLEKVIWDVLPELLRTTLSKEMMAQTVEKVVWEVVVPLAESEIKKEIQRLREGAS